jgi:hypothetical protein
MTDRKQITQRQVKSAVLTTENHLMNEIQERKG